MPLRVAYRWLSLALIVATCLSVCLPAAGLPRSGPGQHGVDHVARVELFGGSSTCGDASLTDMLGEWLVAPRASESNPLLLGRVFQFAIDIALDIVDWLSPSATYEARCDPESDEDEDGDED